MAGVGFSSMFICFLLVLITISHHHATASGGLMPSHCNGTLGDCGDDEVKWLMGSEDSKRLFQQQKYPGYVATHEKGPAIPTPRYKPSGNPGCNQPVYACKNGEGTSGDIYVG